MTTLNKVQARAACKAAGIKNYGKMTVAQMNEAIEALTPWEPKEECVGLKYKTMDPDQVVKALARAKDNAAKRAAKRAADKLVEPTGLKIEKVRPEQNGVKRPSAGGKCRAIWDALDLFVEETGEQPKARDVRELAADENWDPTTSSIQFYQWRKFNGIKSVRGK